MTINRILNLENTGMWSQVGLRKHHYEQSYRRWWNSSWAISNLEIWCCESVALNMPANLEHRRQPTRLPHPWGSPGKNTGVDCHFLLQWIKVKSEIEDTQSCPSPSDPIDCSPPGCPWDFPGKSTGLVCHCLLQRASESIQKKSRKGDGGQRKQRVENQNKKK